MMNRYAWAFAGVPLSMMAAPAMAHEAAAHMHPHGMENGLTLIVAAIILILAAIVARGRS